MNKITCPLNGKTISDFPEIITAEDARKYTGKFNNIPYNEHNARIAKHLAQLIDDAVKLGFKCAEYHGILPEDFKNDLESKKFKVIYVYHIEQHTSTWDFTTYPAKRENTLIIWGDETSTPSLAKDEFLSEEERDEEFKKRDEERKRISEEKRKKEEKKREERIQKIRDEFPKNIMKSEGAGNSGCLLLLITLIIVPIFSIACYFC